MSRKCSPVIALAVVLPPLSACTLPTFDPAKTRAIAAEAQTIVARYPVGPSKQWVELPPRQWPSAIASLKPDRVIVHQWGVDVSIKPYFDGGWGYHISRNKSDLPMPPGCYWERGDNVYWHGPC